MSGYATAAKMAGKSVEKIYEAELRKQRDAKKKRERQQDKMGSSIARIAATLAGGIRRV